MRRPAPYPTPRPSFAEQQALSKAARAEPVVSMGSTFDHYPDSGDEVSGGSGGVLATPPSSSALETVLSFASFHFEDSSRPSHSSSAGASGEPIVGQGRSTAPSSVQSFELELEREREREREREMGEKYETSSGSKTLSPVSGSNTNSKRHGVMWTIGSSTSKGKEEEASRSPTVVTTTKRRASVATPAPVPAIAHKSKFTVGAPPRRAGRSRSYSSSSSSSSGSSSSSFDGDENGAEEYDNEDALDDDDDEDEDEYSLDSDCSPHSRSHQHSHSRSRASYAPQQLHSLEDLLASPPPPPPPLHPTSSSHSHSHSQSEWSRRGRTSRGSRGAGGDEHQYGYDMYGYDGYGYQYEYQVGTPVVGNGQYGYTGGYGGRT